MNRIVRHLIHWSLHRRVPMLIGLVAVTVLLGVLAAQIEIKTNFKDLLGEDLPVMVEYDKLLDNYPDSSAVFIVLEGESADDLVLAGNHLAAVLEADDEWIRDVRWQEDMDFYRSYGLLLWERDDLLDLRDDLVAHPDLLKNGLAGYSITNVFRGMNASFDDYDNVSSVKQDEDDLIRGMTYTGALLEQLTYGLDGSLNQFAIERAITDLQSDPDENSLLRFVDDDGHMISPDGRVALLPVISVGDANDAIYATLLTKHLRDVCAAVEADLPTVQIGLTGFPIVAADEGIAMQERMGLGFIIAIVGILGVFFLAFRSILLPSLAIVPLLVGIVWSVGLVAVTVGEFNLFSLMAPVILLGLGIDYSIHILAQFTQSRGSGRSVEESLTEVFAKIGRGLLIGALTTSATFFAVMVAGFKGINDFGIVGGISVLCAFAAMVLILPLLLSWVDERRTRRGKGAVHVPIPWLGRMAEFLARRRIAVLALVVLILVSGALSIRNLELETDMMKLEPKGLESIRLQELVLDSYDFSIYTTYVMVDQLDDVQRETEQLNALPTVKRTDSLATFLPSEGEQTLRRELITEIEPALRAVSPDPDTSIDRISLDEALAAHSDQLFQMKTLAYMGGMTRLVDEIEWVETKLEETRTALGHTEDSALIALNEIVVEKMQREYNTLIGALDGLHLTRADVPADLIERYVGSDGSYLINVYPTGSPWVSGFADQHLSEVKSVADTPTGVVPIWTEVLDRMIPGFIRASTVALAVLAILLLLDLRSIRRTILILIPLLLSLFLSLALIPVMGMKANVVNLMAFPLILGIGIDDGVHLYHRYFVERKLRRAFSTTGKAILATTLTTIMAMLTLGLSPHRGMVSFAWTASIGVGLCLLLNLLILPGLIRTFDPPEKLSTHTQRRGR